MQSGLQVHKLVRFCTPLTITTNAASTSTNAISTALNEAVGVSELLSLYEQYRIDRVYITLSQQDVPGQVNSGWLWWAIDTDDDTAESQTALFQRSNAKFMPLNELRFKSVNVSYVPRVNVGVSYRDSTTPEGIINSLNTRGWIDVAGNGANVRHYGLKINVVNNGSTAMIHYVTCKMYMSFRGPR